MLLVLAGAQGADLPRGQIIADVKCASDPSQSYALFIPTRYAPDRSWPLILAFDPGGRGRVPVERYQAAAEQYGFIVAGSNNSRNGSPGTGKAVTAMWADLLSHVNVDSRRVYTAGMSGGARVAFDVALAWPAVAGVIASSAGFPDGKPRKSLTFPVFATAGTEDFNRLEMRQLDAALKSPHHLAIFEGGHVWLSSDLAIEAVEWMVVQAMRTGLTPRDEQEIDRILAKRVAAAHASPTAKDRFLAVQSIAADFGSLRDVTSVAAEAAQLGRDKGVRDALKKDSAEDDREWRMLVDIKTLEAQLSVDETRTAVLADLRRRWQDLAKQAGQPDDSPERRFARRVLGGLSAAVTTTDADYLKIIGEFRRGRR